MGILKLSSRWTINVLIAILESKGNKIDKGNGLVNISANWCWELIGMLFSAYAFYTNLLTTFPEFWVLLYGLDIFEIGFMM